MRALDSGLLMLVPLASSAVVYAPIVGNYFFADDFLNLYRIVNVPLLEYVLTPHAGHVLLARNALFWLCRTAFGPRAELFFAAVLLTHLVNVGLLFAAVRSLSGSAALACFGATLWGTAPLHQGTLGWYSVYGQVVATTALLAIVAHAARLSAAGRTPSRAARRGWYGLALVAATSFGVGIGAALALPFVLVLLFPDWRRWSRRPPLLSLLLVVPVLYVAAQALFIAVSGEAIPGLRALSAALGRFESAGSAAGASRLALAAAYARALPATLAMLVELLAYGCAQMLAGFWSVAGAGPALWLAVLTAVAGASIAVASGDAVLRRRLLAAGLLALACYASVAAGRAAVLSALGMAHGALADRYHYAATAPLALLLCLLLHGMQTRLALGRTPVTSLLLLWLAWSTGSYARNAPRIEHHATARLATGLVRAEIARVVDRAPAGDPVYVANRPFAPTASTISPIDFPGWGALFVAFSPDDTVDGRPLRFVIADPAVAQAAQHGRRSATLFTTPDQVPAGHPILQPDAVDAGLIATPFGTPAW
jgi:hypothetical protein